LGLQHFVMLTNINWTFVTSNYCKYASHFGISKIGERKALVIVGCVKMRYLWDHQMQSWKDLSSLHIRTHPTNVINMDSIVSSIPWDHKTFDGFYLTRGLVKESNLWYVYWPCVGIPNFYCIYELDDHHKIHANQPTWNSTF
jgi:hypothetical protein